MLLIAAHPDDETVGAGALLARNAGVIDLLHVTDGAPRARRWWGAPDLRSREEYARVRQKELAEAMSIAGIAADRMFSLGVCDQEATLELAALTERVRAWIEERRPDVVLTHPYEGGHPDHDATAFAVHTACRLLARDGFPVPRLLEFTSYHAGAGGSLVTGSFLPAPGADEVIHTLGAADRVLKQRLLDAFRSQRETLASFRVATERFRAAPAYDFAHAPHPGVLHYERFDWGWAGESWRAHARASLADLRIAAAIPC